MEKQSSLASNPEVVSVDANAAKDLLHSGYQYLDVRMEEDFMSKGHVENAFNIPYFIKTPEGRVKNPNFLEQVSSTLSKEDHFLVGCQTGGRSQLATTELVNAGFKNVRNIGGGFNALVNSGYAAKKPADA